MNQKKKKNNTTASQIEIKELINLYNAKDLVKAKKKAIKLIKKFPKAFLLHNMLGLILSEKNEFKEAEKSFLKTLKINPNFAVAYNNLGNVYKNSGKKDLAIKYYNKCIEKNDKAPEAYNNLGNIFKSLNKLDDAINYYKKALEINPKIFIIHNNLGVAYKISGEIDKAKKSFQESIKIKPDFYYAYRNIGLLSNFEERNFNLLELINNFNKIGNDNAQKRELAFFLGKAHEDIKKFKDSYNYYLIGNNIARKELKYSLNKEIRLLKNIKIFFNKNLYKNKEIKVNKKSITPIFIVGMPRSGTTLVEQILSNHSKVYGAGETEILDKLIFNVSTKDIKNSFLNKKKLLNKNFLNECGNKYILELKKMSTDSKFITDKLPFNFKWIGFIKLILPNAKIIHCKRDSKDTCISIFKNFFPYRAMGFAYSINEIIDYYKSYSGIMNHWNEIFGSYIYNISYENLINSPENEINKLLNFLNLNLEDSCINFYKNNRPVFTASDIQVRKPIYKTSLNSWKSFEDYLPKKFINLK